MKYVSHHSWLYMCMRACIYMCIYNGGMGNKGMGMMSNAPKIKNRKRSVEVGGEREGSVCCHFVGPIE